MILPGRVVERMELLGISQSALARRLGVSQATVSRWRKGEHGAKGAHQLARVLQTTVEYLTGEIDDPDENAPLPPPPLPPAPHLISMQVVFPPVTALEDMFGGMLDAIGDSVSRDELARQLAQLLPRSLSRLKDLRLDWGTPPVQIEASPEFDAAPASADPVHPQ
jgi:transcriptional regulator with XRE-family HTH domain